VNVPEAQSSATVVRPVLGLVGGVASGKSHLARALAARRHVDLVDADQLGHRVLRDPEVGRQLVALWGPQIVDADGEIVRARVAELVFGPDGAAAERRRALESVTHPRIRAAAARQLAQSAQDPACEGSVIDAALLLEAGWSEFCHRVVFVDCPREERLRRAAARGWAAGEVERREASQWPLEKKRARADVVLDNGPGREAVGDLERVWVALLEQVGGRESGSRPAGGLPA